MGHTHNVELKIQNVSGHNVESISSHTVEKKSLSSHAVEKLKISDMVLSIFLILYNNDIFKEVSEVVCTHT